jgi:hypothetical protein
MRQIREVIWERQHEKWQRDVDIQERSTRALMTAVLAAGGATDASKQTAGWQLYAEASEEQETQELAGGGQSTSSVEQATARFGPPMVDYSVIQARADELRRERGLL